MWRNGKQSRRHLAEYKQTPERWNKKTLLDFLNHNLYSSNFGFSKLPESELQFAWMIWKNRNRNTIQDFGMSGILFIHRNLP